MFANMNYPEEDSAFVSVRHSRRRASSSRG